MLYEIHKSGTHSRKYLCNLIITYVTDTILRTLHILVTHLILRTTLFNKYCYYHNLIHNETVALRVLSIFKITG